MTPRQWRRVLVLYRAHLQRSDSPEEAMQWAWSREGRQG